MRRLVNSYRQETQNFRLKQVLCLLLLLTISTVAIPPAFGQLELGLRPVPTLENVQVQAEVNFDPDAQQYTYIYSVGNPDTNTGELWHFGVDVTSRDERRNIPAFDSTGLTIPVGAAGMKPFDEELADRQPLRLPPGTSTVLSFGQQMLSGWTGGLTRHGIAGFFSDARVNRIVPGTSHGGFELISGGLPGIRELLAKADWEYVLESEGDGVPNEEEIYKQIREAITFRTKTLGPTVPPKYFRRLNFLNTIKDYLSETITLGWMIDEALYNTLQTELNTTRSFIEANDTTVAKEALGRFMTALDNASSSQRTTEAYGLLFFNAQYLKDRLPDTYIAPALPVPPEPSLDLAPEDATLPIGIYHTLNPVFKLDGSPAPFYLIEVEVVAGPKPGSCSSACPRRNRVAECQLYEYNNGERQVGGTFS